MPAEGEAIRVDVGAASIDVIDSGTGPGVLLLHEAGAGIDSWAAQVPVLVKGGFRVLVPDLSSLADGEPAVVADIARGLLRVLGVPRVHAVGRGSGGAVAWQLCARHPARVERLALVGWAGDPGGLEPLPEERTVLVVRGAGGANVGEAQLAALAAAVQTPPRVETLDTEAGAASSVAAGRLNTLLLEFLAPAPRPPRAATDVREMLGRTGAGLARRLRGQP